MSDFGPGNKAPQDAASPGSDSNVTYFRDEQGKFATPPDPIGLELELMTQGHIVSTTETASMTQDTAQTVQEPTTEEVTKAVSIFQYMANAVVRASEFAEQLKVLRAEFEEIRHQVEVYRTTNARLDEEVERLRSERTRLQDENAALQAQMVQNKTHTEEVERKLTGVTSDRDHIQAMWVEQDSVLRETRVNLSDTQRRVRELEHELERANAERTRWEKEAHESKDRIERIRHEVAQDTQYAA